MTALAVPDAPDASADDTPAWVDVLKALVRPAGCYATYILTGIVIVALLGLLYLIVLGKVTVDDKLLAVLVAVLGFISGILSLGWSHSFQYIWARRSEKVKNAD